MLTCLEDGFITEVAHLLEAIEATDEPSLLLRGDA